LAWLSHGFFRCSSSCLIICCFYPSDFTLTRKIRSFGLNFTRIFPLLIITLDNPLFLSIRLHFRTKNLIIWLDFRMDFSVAHYHAW
jgi:hypothetical protein